VIAAEELGMPFRNAPATQQAEPDHSPFSSRQSLAEPVDRAVQDRQSRRIFEKFVADQDNIARATAKRAAIAGQVFGLASVFS
jgi:hypothetical protein